MPKKASLFLAITWTTLITFLSLVNVGSLGNSIKIPYKDKMVHFVFYFLFYVLWFSFFKLNTSWPKLKIKILLIAIGYGILMEVLQEIMSNHRTSDSIDVLANSVGAFCGLIAVTYFLSNKKGN
ncbi:VanZ family protein [Flavobacterium sp.]|uniref:VanZ family protein n=1 Tax=Flavobacterium sp. TaxID=239 RepID=UPI002B4B0B9B|nr:VanZ family protein [Flavobacterium sp.]HLP62875.1 VanZ family protein [Flavobacterium sp.]